MPNHNPTSDQIRDLLKRARRIAVIGLSDKPDRDSYVVARYLKQSGYEIIPVNPAVKEVLGHKSYATLREVPGPIDIVNVFRKSEAVAAIVDEAIGVKAASVWLQLGVVDNEAAKKAEEAGLQVVQSKCIKVEHARLVGG
jgi:predicted CoA-binding protein